MPWTTLTINVAGSLLLGALLEALARTGADEGWRRSARLTLGTGVLGGFTTYSTFAVETVQRLTPAAHFVGLAYAVASVVLGASAAAIGYLLARRIGRRPQGQEPRR
jgi:CrcB protein